MVGKPYDSSSLNRQSGTGGQVPCIVHTNNDPMRMGRIQVRPASFDASIPNDRLPWIFPGSSMPMGTGGPGETVHQNYMPGTQMMASMGHDGSWQGGSQMTSWTGGNAPEGSASGGQGAQNTYPPVQPTEIA